MYKLKRLALRVHPHHAAMIERTLSILFCIVIFTGQASAVVRFQDRSLTINQSNPGSTATYTVSFKYATQTAVGSVDMLFCIDPIPYHPCVSPPGLDVSQAVLASQTGEAGFGISTQTPNHLVLSRASPAVVGSDQSTYVFTGIVNPTYQTHSFSIRMTNYASTDATGPFINIGAVVTQITDDIVLQAQVPPMLIFCMAQEVSTDCTQSEGGNESDLGDLDADRTLYAQSQMAVGTNASSGFVITANGTSMAAGTHEIAALNAPTPSLPGNNQFGLNLAENSTPDIGHEPDGAFTNAVATSDYNQPNKFMFRDGDVVASAPNVSLIRRFTTSYIVNVRPDLRAGVYTTTITYICSGRF